MPGIWQPYGYFQFCIAAITSITTTTEGSRYFLKTIHFESFTFELH